MEFRFDISYLCDVEKSSSPMESSITAQCMWVESTLGASSFRLILKNHGSKNQNRERTRFRSHESFENHLNRLCNPKSRDGCGHIFYGDINFG